MKKMIEYKDEDGYGKFAECPFCGHSVELGDPEPTGMGLLCPHFVGNERLHRPYGQEDMIVAVFEV